VQGPKENTCVGVGALIGSKNCGLHSKKFNWSSYGYLEDYYNFHKLNLEFFVHFYIKKKKESY